MLMWTPQQRYWRTRISLKSAIRRQRQNVISSAFPLTIVHVRNNLSTFATLRSVVNVGSVSNSKGKVNFCTEALECAVFEIEIMVAARDAVGAQTRDVFGESEGTEDVQQTPARRSSDAYAAGTLMHRCAVVTTSRVEHLDRIVAAPARDRAEYVRSVQKCTRVTLSVQGLQALSELMAVVATCDSERVRLGDLLKSQSAFGAADGRISSGPRHLWVLLALSAKPPATVSYVRVPLCSLCIPQLLNGRFVPAALVVNPGVHEIDHRPALVSTRAESETSGRGADIADARAPLPCVAYLPWNLTLEELLAAVCERRDVESVLRRRTFGIAEMDTRRLGGDGGVRTEWYTTEDIMQCVAGCDVARAAMVGGVQTRARRRGAENVHWGHVTWMLHCIARVSPRVRGCSSAAEADEATRELVDAALRSAHVAAAPPWALKLHMKSRTESDTPTSVARSSMNSPSAGTVVADKSASASASASAIWDEDARLEVPRRPPVLAPPTRQVCERRAARGLSRGEAKSRAARARASGICVKGDEAAGVSRWCLDLPDVKHAILDGHVRPHVWFDLSAQRAHEDFRRGHLARPPAVETASRDARIVARMLASRDGGLRAWWLRVAPLPTAEESAVLSHAYRTAIAGGRSESAAWCLSSAGAGGVKWEKAGDSALDERLSPSSPSWPTPAAHELAAEYGVTPESVMKRALGVSGLVHAPAQTTDAHVAPAASTTPAETRVVTCVGCCEECIASPHLERAAQAVTDMAYKIHGQDGSSAHSAEHRAMLLQLREAWEGRLRECACQLSARVLLPGARSAAVWTCGSQHAVCADCAPMMLRSIAAWASTPGSHLRAPPCVVHLSAASSGSSRCASAVAAADVAAASPRHARDKVASAYMIRQCESACETALAISKSLRELASCAADGDGAEAAGGSATDSATAARGASLAKEVAALRSALRAARQDLAMSSLRGAAVQCAEPDLRDMSEVRCTRCGATHTFLPPGRPLPLLIVCGTDEGHGVQGCGAILCTGCGKEAVRRPRQEVLDELMRLEPSTASGAPRRYECVAPCGTPSTCRALAFCSQLRAPESSRAVARGAEGGARAQLRDIGRGAASGPERTAVFSVRRVRSPLRVYVHGVCALHKQARHCARVTVTLEGERKLRALAARERAEADMRRKETSRARAAAAAEEAEADAVADAGCDVSSSSARAATRKRRSAPNGGVPCLATARTERARAKRYRAVQRLTSWCVSRQERKQQQRLSGRGTGQARNLGCAATRWRHQEKHAATDGAENGATRTVSPPWAQDAQRLFGRTTDAAVDAHGPAPLILTASAPALAPSRSGAGGTGQALQDYGGSSARHSTLSRRVELAKGDIGGVMPRGRGAIDYRERAWLRSIEEEHAICVGRAHLPPMSALEVLTAAAEHARAHAAPGGPLDRTDAGATVIAAMREPEARRLMVYDVLDQAAGAGAARSSVLGVASASAHTHGSAPATATTPPRLPRWLHTARREIAAPPEDARLLPRSELRRCSFTLEDEADFAQWYARAAGGAAAAYAPTELERLLFPGLAPALPPAAAPSLAAVGGARLPRHDPLQLLTAAELVALTEAALHAPPSSHAGGGEPAESSTVRQVTRVAQAQLRSLCAMPPALILRLRGLVADAVAAGVAQRCFMCGKCNVGDGHCTHRTCCVGSLTPRDVAEESTMCAVCQRALPRDFSRVAHVHGPLVAPHLRYGRDARTHNPPIAVVLFGHCPLYLGAVVDEFKRARREMASSTALSSSRSPYVDELESVDDDDLDALMEQEGTLFVLPAAGGLAEAEGRAAEGEEGRRGGEGQGNDVAVTQPDEAFLGNVLQRCKTAMLLRGLCRSMGLVTFLNVAAMCNSTVRSAVGELLWHVVDPPLWPLVVVLSRGTSGVLPRFASGAVATSGSTWTPQMPRGCYESLQQAALVAEGRSTGPVSRFGSVPAFPVREIHVPTPPAVSPGAEWLAAGAVNDALRSAMLTSDTQGDTQEFGQPFVYQPSWRGAGSVGGRRVSPRRSVARQRIREESVTRTRAHMQTRSATRVHQ